MKTLCPRDHCKNEAIIDTRFGVLPCQMHQDKDAKIDLPVSGEFYNRTKADRIQKQRDEHNGDILQPYLPGKEMNPNPDFVKRYPDRAKDYFTEDQLTKL